MAFSIILSIIPRTRNQVSNEGEILLFNITVLTVPSLYRMRTLSWLVSLIRHSPTGMGDSRTCIALAAVPLGPVHSFVNQRYFQAQTMPMAAELG